MSRKGGYSAVARRPLIGGQGMVAAIPLAIKSVAQRFHPGGGGLRFNISDIPKWIMSKML